MKHAEDHEAISPGRPHEAARFEQARDAGSGKLLHVLFGIRGEGQIEQFRPPREASVGQDEARSRERVAPRTPLDRVAVRRPHRRLGKSSSVSAYGLRRGGNSSRYHDRRSTSVECGRVLAGADEPLRGVGSPEPPSGRFSLQFIPTAPTTKRKVPAFRCTRYGHAMCTRTPGRRCPLLSKRRSI